MKYKSLLLVPFCLLALCSCGNSEQVSQSKMKVSCNSDSGVTNEITLGKNAFNSIVIENNAQFETTISMQKENLFGNWKDINISDEDSIKVDAQSKKEITFSDDKYDKGTYRFVANGSYGDNYDYAVTMNKE